MSENEQQTSPQDEKPEGDNSPVTRKPVPRGRTFSGAGTEKRG